MSDRDVNHRAVPATRDFSSLRTSDDSTSILAFQHKSSECSAGCMVANR